MLSIPPATITSWLPTARLCAAIITAFIPEAHTLLIVVQGVEIGSPAPRVACLAGACPEPADTTLPMYTS